MVVSVLRMNGSGIRQLDSRATHVSVSAIAIPLFALLLAARPADGEIFKCTAKKAMPTYQNFPCEYESLDALQPINAAGTAASTVSASQDVAGGAAVSAQRGMHTNPVAVASVPRVGMTANQVKAIWGEPLDTTKEEYARGDIETWTYADSRSIRFDPRGRVMEIKW